MKNSTLKSFAQLILFIGLLFGITACTGILPTKISDLENNTQYYSNKTVKIKGKVEESFSLLLFSGFTVNDGSGTILVVGSNYSPAPNTTISVKGKVSTPIRLEDITLLVLKVEE